MFACPCFYKARRCSHIHTIGNRSPLHHTVCPDHRTTGNVRTREYLGTRSNPDIVTYHNSLFPDGLQAYWCRRILVVMLKRNYDDVGGDAHIVADPDSAVSQQDGIVIDRDIISDVDVPTLSIDDHATTSRKPVANFYAAPAPESRPIAHIGCVSDAKRAAREHPAELDKKAEIQASHRSEPRIDGERLVEPLVSVFNLLPVFEPRASIGVVDPLGVAGGWL